MTKDLKPIIKALLTQGWRVELKGSHYRAYPSDPTVESVTFSVTPSDHRALKNIKADLKRHGAIL